MEKLLLMLLIITLKDVCSMEPTISQNCKGEHQYLDKNGKCRLCNKCPAGSQPTGFCGHGERVMDYKCETCPNGSYSLHNDYNLCIHCRPCKSWNSLVYRECAPKHNRICGRCFDGHFRPRKSDGILDDECHLCDATRKGAFECREDVDEFPWKIVAISAFAGYATLVTVVALCCCWQRRRRKAVNHEKKPPVGTPLPDDRMSDTAKPESSPNRSLLRLSGPDSRSESELQTDSRYSLSGHSSQISVTDTRPAKSLPVSRISEIVVNKPAATRHMPSFRSITGNHISYSGYSDAPTAEYQEPLLSYNNRQSLSNMPTTPYDEIDGNRSFRSHSAHHRPQTEQSSSCENLLENADRDSKDVGIQQASYEYQADSFDTRSCGDPTKAYIPGHSW